MSFPLMAIGITNRLRMNDVMPLSDFTIHEIHPQLRIRVTRSMPSLPAAVDARVEALWQAAIRRVSLGGAGQLFNGQVFSADVITAREITGHMTEFRRIVAQMDSPSLEPELRVRPLAVCGVVLCPDGVVVGRRPSGAVYQAGMWQLPPAGSVDHHALRPDGEIDYGAQLLAELTEELGLEADCVSSPRLLCAVEHPGSRVTDLGISLTTAVPGPNVLTVHRTHGNGEYEPLLVVPVQKLSSFVAEADETLVPPAREFLFRLGLLPQGLSPPRGP